MTKHVSLFLSLICLIPCFIVLSQTGAERAQAFILESKRLPVAERVDRAIGTIENSTDDVIVGNHPSGLPTRIGPADGGADGFPHALKQLCNFLPRSSGEVKWGLTA